MQPQLAKLIQHVNRKSWWHVPPQDPEAYKKRGKFYASSFHEAEFWGRPLDQSMKVAVSNPLIGDERTIERKLFGRLIPHPVPDSDKVLEWRWNTDAKMKKLALKKGFDSIILLTPKAFATLKQQGKLPRSIELNVLNG